MASKSGYTQRGSAIIYIFIGVALFGALMFMFSRGASQNSSSVSSKADNALAISEIVSYAQTVERAVNKLISKGCSESNLRFYYPDFDGAGDYAGQAEYSDPNQNQCFVFVPTAGGVKWKRPPKIVGDLGGINNNDYFFSGNIGVWNVGNNDCETTELMISTRVSRDLCMAYNEKFGVVNTGGEPPEYQRSGGSAGYQKFGWGGGDGFWCGHSIGYPSDSPPGTELVGRTAGCYHANDSGDYYFYYVLLAR